MYPVVRICSGSFATLVWEAVLLLHEYLNIYMNILQLWFEAVLLLHEYLPVPPQASGYRVQPSPSEKILWKVFSVSNSFLVFSGNLTFWIFAVWPRATAPVEGTAPFVGFSLTWTNIITKSAFLFNGFNKRSSPNFNSLDWCYVVFFWFRLLNENCVYYLLIFAVVRETQDGRERSGVSVFKSWFITLLQLEPQYCGGLYKLAIPIVKLALLLSIDANAHYNRFMNFYTYQLRYNS